MPSIAYFAILASVALALGLAAVLIHGAIRYAPIIVRIFEEKPLFLPLRIAPVGGGEDVRFPTADGLELGGSYFKARTKRRTGVLVFCHEYLSNRWSFQAYVGHLRDQGFDVFAFDFRNHGASGSDARYHPLQWVTGHEVNDLRAALAYLRSRDDHDTAGFGLFGVSRGGGTALVVAAEANDVWGVVTDGAFPTKGTMLAYIFRWSEIYITHDRLRKAIPLCYLQYLSWLSRVRSGRRLHCAFPDVEKAVSRIAPRPWLLIHGEKDAYIGPDIARRLFDEAGDPREMWIVPGAKHNRCRELQPEAYADRIKGFFDRFAPRPPVAAPKATKQKGPSWASEPRANSSAELAEAVDSSMKASAATLATPVSG